jgi:hypothetical protein
MQVHGPGNCLGTCTWVGDLVPRRRRPYARPLRPPTKRRHLPGRRERPTQPGPKHLTIALCRPTGIRQRRAASHGRASSIYPPLAASGQRAATNRHSLTALPPALLRSRSLYGGWWPVNPQKAGHVLEGKRWELGRFGPSPGQ